MTKSTGITWAAASARRLERQFLARRARTGTPVADVAAAMLGVHAQVLSAAELSVGLRADGVTRTDVRDALWPTAPLAPPAPALVKTHGPRGTVHLLPARDLPMWCAALPAIPAGPAAFPTDVRLTGEQAGQVVAAIADALDGTFLTVDELGEEVVARTGPWAGDLVMPAFQTMWPRWRQGPAPGRPVRRPVLRPEPRPQGDVHPAAPLHPAAARGGVTAPRTPIPVRVRTGDAPALRPLAGRTTRLGEGPLRRAGRRGRDRGGPLRGRPGVGGGGRHRLPRRPGTGRAAARGAVAAVLRRVRRRRAAAGTALPGAAYRRALAGGQAGNFPVLLVDGVAAGVWHQRRRGRRTTVTVEPLARLTARQERELADCVERVGAVLEAAAELVIGEVTVGAHA